MKKYIVVARLIDFKRKRGNFKFTFHARSHTMLSLKVPFGATFVVNTPNLIATIKVSLYNIDLIHFFMK